MCSGRYAVRDEESEVTQVELVLCTAGDGRKSWQEVWGKPMCHHCAMAWGEEAPTDEYWYATHPDDNERFAVKRAWTARWLSERKARVAA